MTCVRDLHAAAGMDTLRHSLEILSRAIPAEYVGIHAASTRDPKREMAVYPFEAISPSEQATIGEVIHQHPFFSHPVFIERFASAEALRRYPAPRVDDGFLRRFLGGEIVAVSEAISARARRKLMLYGEVLDRIGASDSIGMLVHYAPNAQAVFAFSRGRRSFTEEERQILRLLKPFILDALGTSGSRIPAISAMSRADGAASPQRAPASRDAQIQAAMLRGKTDEEIAEELGLLTRTVRKDRARLGRLLLAGGPAGGARNPRAGAEMLGGESADPRARISRLTHRELAVARLLAHGLQTKEIAAKLGTSPATVHKQTMAVYAKLKVSGRTEAAVFMARFDDQPDCAT